MAPDRRAWGAPGRALVGLAVAVGLALGIGAYTFVYARGASYLTNDPAACANCHVMREQLHGWTVGSRRAVAVCNDCHTPPGLLGKYTTKALNCHMPYTRVGALKISDHHVRSPLLNVNRACQTCHKWSEAELTARVQTIQQRTYELRNRAMDALMALIVDLTKAAGAGQSDAQLAAARDFQRRAQFYLDFVEAENSTGFHAPQEAARILAESIDFTRQGQLALRDARGR
jgi:cytochrome c nitrite reductase small subunit